MRKIRKLVLLFILSLCSLSSLAEGWPANYKGVMLQGFYWDSYTDTKWTNLQAQSDELSKYFSLIWVPNSAKSASGYMGYDPVYWFTNHNTRFGTESELRSMIATFKSKGVGIIEDVVVNHRSGVSNWTNFPAETWNGKTWKLGPEHICCTDEVKDAAGQAKPTGAPDTGDDFNGSRDLDHTNATVQDNIKNYCKFLLEDLGYAGFRYDMVKGYSGKYTKIYNQYSRPEFSVGEYWDGQYDALKAWIDATGKESAAFDFAFKYAVNEAFHSNDMRKLVWNANGTTPQPAGLIHFAYQRYAVTFIDNHDTYRDGSKFNGNVVAANAFMLLSPGTPCVFLPHYKQYKAQIQALIDIRNAAGIHNQSAVKVLKTAQDCYMAEITGTNGKVVVKIGSSMDSPSGYTNSDIKASGTDYCVWSKVSGSVVGGDDQDEPFNLYFDNKNSSWTTPHIYYWGSATEAWPGVAMQPLEGSIWVYQVPAGTTGVLFNAGDGDATKTNDFIAEKDAIYTTSGKIGTYNGGQTGSYPEELYLVGTINGTEWATAHGVLPDEKKDGVYVYDDVEIDDAGEGFGYITFVTALDEKDGDWKGANQSDRYGAVSKDENLTEDAPAVIKCYVAMVDASSAQSWAVIPGRYKIKADLKQMKLSLMKTSGISAIDVDDKDAEYYNFQGVRVLNPTPGIYIVKRGMTITREVIR